MFVFLGPFRSVCLFRGRNAWNESHRHVSNESHRHVKGLGGKLFLLNSGLTPCHFLFAMHPKGVLLMSDR